MNNNPQLEEYERLVRESSLRAEEAKVQSMQQEAMLMNQDKSMVQEQLDLGEELERIDYLLRGYTLETNAETREREWVKPDDNEKIILSDFGVHLIRNTIAWYINKNTLLSNYDEETILHKMKDFANDLNDTIFMEYEKVFQYPSFEDCRAVLNTRIENKAKIRLYALEILGKKATPADELRIRSEILKELEPMIQRELEKIKQQIIKNKLKRFMLIIREVQDAVHSTYLRALAGQERRTLREHITISETKGNVMQMGGQKGGNMLDMFRRR